MPAPTTQPPTTRRARGTLDTAFTVGPVRRRLFGSFAEHMGRCVYTGLYEPGHPTADADGFRGDVAALVAELGVSLVRYPGGNFVSAYDWTDGIGPKDERPRRVELAWGSVETNQVGTDEFLGWCERVGVEPMLAVNLGTRGVAEALQLLEYCNSPRGTDWADRRVAHGRAEPWDVRLWCLGNEMDGPWQVGRKTPEAYAELAEQTGRAMRRMHPDLELVACGSSVPTIATFGRWERTVLQRVGDVAQHLSLHLYYEPDPDDPGSFLAAGADMSRRIDDVVAIADAVAAEQGSQIRTTLSVDEWNVWYASRGGGYDLDGTQHQAEGWPDLRRVAEEVYTAADAVVVGSLLISLLQHTDRVAMACQSELVNVVAPIMTRPGGPAWRQTIFHPFALTSRHARGEVLRPAISSPTVSTRAFGEVEQLQLTATWAAGTGELAVFAVNRSPDQPLRLDLELPRQLAGAGVTELVEHLAIAEPDPGARNTETDPGRVLPRPKDGSSCAEGVLSATLPAGSWHLIRLRAV